MVDEGDKDNGVIVEIPIPKEGQSLENYFNEQFKAFGIEDAVWTDQNTWKSTKDWPDPTFGYNRTEIMQRLWDAMSNPLNFKKMIGADVGVTQVGMEK